MKKHISDSDMPFGRLKHVDDFLPSPHELAMPEDTVKVTISLRRSSVHFFKEQAKRNGSKYQRMIRALLDRYAERYA
jgi:predicted DNA binding CopG/RHH family protein